MVEIDLIKIEPLVIDLGELEIPIDSMIQTDLIDCKETNKKNKKKMKRKYGVINSKSDLVNGVLEGCHRNIGTSLIPSARIKKGFRKLNPVVKISKKIYEPFRVKLIDFIYDGVFSIIQHLKDISKKTFRLDASQVLFKIPENFINLEIYDYIRLSTFKIYVTLMKNHLLNGSKFCADQRAMSHFWKFVNYKMGLFSTFFLKLITENKRKTLLFRDINLLNNFQILNSIDWDSYIQLADTVTENSRDIKKKPQIKISKKLKLGN